MTVSKHSDFGFMMVVCEYFFMLELINIYSDGTDIFRFLKVQVMWAIMQFYDGEIRTKSVIISAIPIYC